jgi:hypothetical protein
MPLYHFQCIHCEKTRRRILEPDQVGAVVVLCECGELMDRKSKPPTTKITETLDNGAMVRKVERPADAEQLYRERAHGKKGNI